MGKQRGKYLLKLEKQTGSRSHKGQSIAQVLPPGYKEREKR
jgi:hypothetical protein